MLNLSGLSISKPVGVAWAFACFILVQGTRDQLEEKKKAEKYVRVRGTGARNECV